MSIVAENVNRIVAEKCLKKSAIARKANMTPQTLSNLLSGRKVIRAEHIPLLAYALGVEPNDLFRIH